MPTPKLTFDEVKQLFADAEYTLVSKTYTAANKKLMVLCPRQHFIRKSVKDLEKSAVCPNCAADDKLRAQLQVEKDKLSAIKKELRAKAKQQEKAARETLKTVQKLEELERKKQAIEERKKQREIIRRNVKYTLVKETIEAEGYTLLSDEYINNRTKLVVQCPHGHDPYTVTFNAYSNGHRCPDCGNIKRSLALQLKYKDVLDRVIEAGFELISTSYEGVYKPLIFRCPEGHTFKRDLDSFEKVQNKCPVCAELNYLCMDTKSDIYKGFTEGSYGASKEPPEILRRRKMYEWLNDHK